MPKNGPIILIDDDNEDQEIFDEVLKDLHIHNPLVHFTDSIQAFSYLKETPEQPYLIFCDVNLPKQTGLEFKRQIDEDPKLRRKSIPFIFYSTSVDQKSVNEAYTQMTVQGFFQKGNSYETMKKDLKLIFDYWSSSKHPNTR